MAGPGARPICRDVTNHRHPPAREVLRANLDASVPPGAAALVAPDAAALSWAAGGAEAGEAVVEVVYARRGGPAMAGILYGVEPAGIGPGDLDRVEGAALPVGCRPAAGSGRTAPHHPLRAAALDALVAACDPEALDLMMRLGLRSWEIHAWLTGRNRDEAMRFVRRHPWLAPAAAARAESGDTLPSDPDGLAASLLDGLVPGRDVRALARRMRGFVLPEDLVELEACAELAALADLPDALFPPPLPEDEPGESEAQQGYLALFTLAKHVVRFAALSGREPGAVLGRVGDWGAYARGLAVRARLPDGPDDFPGHWGWVLSEDVACNISETVLRFAEEVLRPAARIAFPDAGPPPERHRYRTCDIPRGSLAEAAARLLLGGRTLPALAELSARWHGRADGIARLLAERAGDAAPTGPRLFAETEAGDGYRLASLATPRELVAEGSPGPDASGVAGLAHCVGGYAEAVARGLTAVVSLRRAVPGGYERVSTAEVDVGPVAQGLPPSIEQHRGRGNAAPGAAAEAALRRGLGAVAAEAHLRLAAHLAAGPAPFDWSAAFACVRAWEEIRDAWAFAVPRPLRGAGPAELLAAAGYHKAL